jgi:hypothetical protein
MHASSEGMHAAHGFNDFFSIVEGGPSSQDDPAANALFPDYGAGGHTTAPSQRRCPSTCSSKNMES